jgi:hypothetical protein
MCLGEVALFALQIRAFVPRYLRCKYARAWLCPISIGLPHPRRRRHPCPGALCAQNTAILGFSLFDSENPESKAEFLP